MNELQGKWAGRIFGTNTGNLFLDIIQDQDQLSGEARINDLDYGITIFSLSGHTNGKIEFAITPLHAREGIEVGHGKVLCELKPDGSLEGTWETAIGSAGTFRAYPHFAKVPQASSQEPEQIYNRTLPVGSLRLFKKDIEHIFNVIKKDFIEGKLIVTYSMKGSEITKYADSFLRDSNNIGAIKTIKMAIQEHESHGINRMVNVDLFESGESAIRVSGTKESWVLGKAESIYNSLSNYQNNIITKYKKYGLNINQIIFLLMLVFIPEISSWPKRLLFVGSVFSILIFLFSMHSKITPNTIVFMNDKVPNFWERSWPSLLSWLIAASSSIFAMWLFKYLTDHS